MGPMELLAHPVRLRIVHAMSGGHTLTTAQLCARLPDVSKATIYRHVDLLTSGGILEVTEERRVRGAVERHYRLRRERAVIDTDAVAAASRDDHRAVFTTAMTILLAEFNTYLDRENADPATDSVGYRQHALWLDPAELADLIADMRAAILPHLNNEPADGRRHYLLSPILFPIGDMHAESQDGADATE
ncbi:helix-turn-helix domain-containing protein [Nocardia mikamii]|uniref:helix-turn-helix domain-containing protein n=1 Tax=Nocardia mikamii TaxID=508464 RepID=UPI0007A5622A|nr:helix-turn-helix domain-containing protein [Nocardia mikamii]